MLEFICALQSEHLTPEKLFHELEHNHLLLIGSNFSNWLARLFLRMAKRRRLSDPRDVGEVLADDHTRQRRAADGLPAAGERAHARLQRRASSSSTSCTGAGRRAGGSPADVIALGAAPRRFLPPEREMPDNAVFISYAREDLPAVQRLKAGARRGRHRRPGSTSTASRAATTTTARSSANIARCSLLPAGRSRRRPSAGSRRYFRREWSYAVDRTRNMADERGVHPAGLHRRHRPDAERAACRTSSRRVHITRLPGGEPTPGVRAAPAGAAREA
ncbi:MAG: hypothetical protein MZW92_67495 [Comamonadaceae bacterium]|nr:hypothetical protein [Comamonadaceae bacterium]